jgi:hypothetical protein
MARALRARAPPERMPVLARVRVVAEHEQRRLLEIDVPQ